MSIGARLSSARIGLGMSVAEVSAKTRLRGGIIENLESNYITYDAEVFVRAHIKAVAGVVGEDYEELVAMLHPAVEDEHRPSRFRRSDATAGEEVVERPADSDLDIFEVGKRDALPPQRSGNIRALIIGVLALAVVLLAVRFAVGFFTSSAEPTPEPTISESVSVEPTSEPTASESKTPKPTANPSSDVTLTVPVVGTGAIVVELRCAGNSWVLVENLAGEELFRRDVADGENYEFRDNAGLKVTVSQADNVKFRVNRIYVGRIGTGKKSQTFDDTTIPELTGKA